MHIYTDKQHRLHVKVLKKYPPRSTYLLDNVASSVSELTSSHQHGMTKLQLAVSMLLTLLLATQVELSPVDLQVQGNSVGWNQECQEGGRAQDQAVATWPLLRTIPCTPF